VYLCIEWGNNGSSLWWYIYTYSILFRDRGSYMHCDKVNSDTCKTDDKYSKIYVEKSEFVISKLMELNEVMVLVQQYNLLVFYL